MLLGSRNQRSAFSLVEIAFLQHQKKNNIGEALNTFEDSYRHILLCSNFMSTVISLKPGVGNFFSRRAICGKTKSFPGRIIKWIEFNIFSNYYCQGCSDWKAKKRFTHPQMSCFSTKKSKKRSTRLQMSCFVPKISVKQCRSEKFLKGGHNFHIFLIFLFGITTLS